MRFHFESLLVLKFKFNALLKYQEVVHKASCGELMFYVKLGGHI